MGSGLSVLLVEDAKDTGSDLVVDDGLVIFADNVDAELLIKCGGVMWLSDIGSDLRDLRRCRRTSIRKVRILDLHH